MSETKVNETKPSEPRPKKIVRRIVAMAFGMICIILAVGLVGVFAYYVAGRKQLLKFPEEFSGSPKKFLIQSSRRKTVLLPFLI
jgi:nitrate reductase NapE component